MRKLYLLFLFLVCSVGFIHAQGWYVYDGSAIPTAVGWTSSSNNPGPNFVEEVLDDPNIAGNSVYRYIQPDANSVSDPSGTRARKQYYRAFDAAYKGINYTTVLRIKGYPVDSLSGENIFNVECHNKVSNRREDIYFAVDDSTIKLGRANVTAPLNADLKKWHIFRITVINDSTTVFMDEDPTPVVAGKTATTTTNHYLRVGDGGTPRVAGYVDWIIIDTTGAYAPGVGAAIPAELSTDVNVSDMPGFGKKVVFLTDTTLKGVENYYADSNYIRDLADQGFIVNMVGRADVTAQSASLKALVNASDIIIVGRGCNSADFADGVEVYWEKQKKPMIVMSNLIARSNKMKLVPSITSLNVARFGTLEGKILNPEDTAFKNMVLPADSIIPFAMSNIGLLTYTPEQRAKINGEVIMTLANGPEAYKVSTTANTYLDTLQLSDYNGLPLMIRFAPLDSTYTGKEGAYLPARPFHWCTYITGGDDSDWDTINNRRKRAYYVHTPEMNTVLVNEILYLISKPVPNISDDNTLSTLTASVGTFNPAFSPSVNTYTLSVPEGTTTVTFNAAATHPEAVVTGAGAFATIPGTDTISVKSQAGSVQDYIIVVKFATVIAGNIVPPGDGTLDEYIDAANDGDTLILINDSSYYPISTIVIDKHLVIRAQEYPELPLLEKLPHVINKYGNTDMFLMADGGYLELIGIDLDGLEGSATKIISLRSVKASSKMYINRCRMHDVTGDIIGGNKSDSCEVTNFYIRNSFLYNADLHGAYIKDVWVGDGVTDSRYKWEDITFWNLGQQIEWFQNYSTVTSQTYTMDHMTGYNLGTNTTWKELVGNTDGIADVPVVYHISLTNSIFSAQDAGNDQPSLMFSTTSAAGVNTITLRNIVLFEVNEPAPRSGSNPIDITNRLNDDPQFADPGNGDFTIGNTAYLTAGDEGSIIGARYWAPDFVDDFKDVLEPETGINVSNAELAVNVYPNPFGSEISFVFNIDNANNVTITLYDLTGRTVKILNENIISGSNEVVLRTNELEAGTYFYTIQAGKAFTSGHVLKLK